MLNRYFRKSFEYEAVTYDGGVYCNECSPVELDNEGVFPVFTDSEWDYAPVCEVCGNEHTYVTILEERG